MNYHAGTYDVIVIGAGHAGIEAALASARLGCKTVIFTINMDAVGNCPCNPSIGGTAKGHLVREIDALGGEMGRTADASFIQSRMLNLGKGPAVHSLRAQIDRREYSKIMKHKLELQENLHLKQAEIISIDKNEDGTWKGKGYDMVDIGGNTWISSQCVVLPGTKFPSYSVCALGSILNKDYSNNERGLYAGRPAKLIKAGIWRDMSDDIVHYDENL